MDKQIHKIRLSELMTRVSKNNKDEEFSVEEILSLSSTKGIVDRKELLGDTYDKVNHKNYIKTRLNDLVYGKSISADYPYGLFKVNDCRDGLLSTLYFTFKVNNNVYPKYLDRYFSYHNRANNFLKKYVLVGDRYITADANYILSGKIFTPQLAEQKNIAHFFSTLDKKLNQLQEKKTTLELYKKGMMQQIFSQQLSFKDDNGQDFPEWEFKKLGDVTKINQGLQIKITDRFTSKVENSFFYITNEFLRKGNKKAFYIKNPTKSVICNEDDILMTRTGNTGMVVTGVKGAFHNNFFKINFDRKTISKDFLYFFLTLEETQHTIIKLAGNSTIPDLNHGDFYGIKIHTPTFKEQTKIANFLSKIDEKINTIAEQIEKTKTYKKGLLQKMFV